MVKWFCKKRNHAMTRRSRYRITRSADWNEYRTVAHIDTIEVIECLCGKHREGQIVSTRSLTGLSMPTSYWDEMKEFGALVEVV